MAYNDVIRNGKYYKSDKDADIGELTDENTALHKRVKELEEAYLGGCFGLFNAAQKVQSKNQQLQARIAELEEGLKEIGKIRALFQDRLDQQAVDEQRRRVQEKINSLLEKEEG